MSQIHGIICPIFIDGYALDLWGEHFYDSRRNMSWIHVGVMGGVLSVSHSLRNMI
ncbi:hypothetical protein QJS10_CPA03g00091 [Acorus calamus]|uniref:Uncharacterized protein n=1 Tax=Acorus calamus TaxID=4465 RepID=A0AAV9F541_ACOCL|nr:hypothetical protein QJS10_CPA03g00091 [Acorus calamus]